VLLEQQPHGVGELGELRERVDAGDALRDGARERELRLVRHDDPHVELRHRARERELRLVRHDQCPDELIADRLRQLFERELARERHRVEERERDERLSASQGFRACPWGQPNAAA